MKIDGYSVSSVTDDLGLGNTNLLYRWKAELVTAGGPVAETLDSEVEFNQFNMMHNKFLGVWNYELQTARSRNHQQLIDWQCR